MGNRIDRFWKKPERLSDIRRFFLACEFKPRTSLWSVLDPVAYDVKPAFIHGKLGRMAYSPASYSIISIDEADEPLVGYLVTISNPDGILLLDKIKGFNGSNSYNTHYRCLAHAYTSPQKVITAWCYMISPKVLEVYQSIEQIEWGLWEQDEKQIELLDKLTKPD